MTEQQALKYIETVKACSGYTGEEWQEAFDVAIECIKMRTAKRPMFIYHEMIVNGYYKCKNCGTAIIDAYKFCHGCGQRIEWG